MIEMPEEIQGERITLKRHKVELAQTMYDYIDKDRERLSQFLPWPDFIKSVDDEVNFIKRCDESWEKALGFQFGIYNDQGTYMGNVGCFGRVPIEYVCEIGYWILGDFEGKGFMSEAVSTLQKKLFSLGVHRIQIRCSTENSRSSNIPKSLGYHLDGVERESVFASGRYHNLEIYSRLSTD